MVVPDLYVFTLKFYSNFSLYKKDKIMKKKIYFYLYFMQLFSADAMIFSKKKFKIFFDPKKVKKPASKVAHNRP